jgi:uncharacterized protein
MRNTAMDFILFYDVTPQYIVRRGEFRAEHLRLAWEYADRGELLVGGALEEPIDCTLLVFRCASKDTVEQFIARDPYVANGLVASWRIRPWRTVVGPMAATPLRPEASQS